MSLFPQILNTCSMGLCIQWLSLRLLSTVAAECSCQPTAEMNTDTIIWYHVPCARQPHDDRLGLFHDGGAHSPHLNSYLFWIWFCLPYPLFKFQQYNLRFTECLIYHHGIPCNMASDQKTSTAARCPFIKGLGLSLTGSLTKFKKQRIKQAATPQRYKFQLCGISLHFYALVIVISPLFHSVLGVVAASCPFYHHDT